MNRREFAKLAALTPLASVLGVAPELALSADIPATESGKPNKNRILLLVELAGGNDGLNTLIPQVKNQNYIKRRPNLAQKKVIDIGSGVAMHTSLEPLKAWWEKGQLSWIQNVGYARPDRSHFRSRDIWETASSSDHQLRDGWLSMVLPEKEHGLHGVVIGSGLGPLAGKQCRAVAMHDPRTFVEQAQLVEKAECTTSNPSLAHIIDVQHQVHGAEDLLKRSIRVRNVDRFFRRSNFNNDLKSVAKMIVGGANAMVYKVTLPGFDTHASQAVTHKNQLSYLAEGLDSFAKAMEHFKLWDNVLVMTYSEFGRSLKENLSGGTDHGTSAPQLVMGGKVKGGQLYGESPDLNNLDSEGDIQYTTEFHSLYASIAKNWWGLENPWAQHSPIPFV